MEADFSFRNTTDRIIGDEHEENKIITFNVFMKLGNFSRLFLQSLN